MKNYKIQINEIEKNKFNLIFSGKLILENISTIKNELKKKLTPESEYQIDFEKLNQVDFSFIQLLLVLENDDNFKNISINYDTIYDFKDFKRYISFKKL